jgi:hypothetical protein
LANPKNIQLGLLVAFSAFLGTATLFASDQVWRDFTFAGSLQGSSNSWGTINRFNTSTAHSLNRFLEVEAGIPFYFVMPSSLSTSYTGNHSVVGIGSAYGSLRFNLNSSTARFSSSLTGTAPTGDKNKGFSTGRSTVNWTNTLSRDMNWWMPYASVSLSNALSDTSFFGRPYNSIGFVAQVEGGSSFRLNRLSYAGGSAYKVIPSGKQTVISWFVPREEVVPVIPEMTGRTDPATRRRGRRSNRRNGEASQSNPQVSVPATTTIIVYDEIKETIVEAELAKDYGFSTWIALSPSPHYSFYAGVSRSIPFQMNTVFWGTSLDLRAVMRRQGNQ